MAIVTGDRYLELLARFIEQQAGSLLDGGLVLKLNPVGLHYVQTRLEALQELEQLRSGAPVDYLRAYVADLGDHRALEKLRRVLRLLGSLQVVAVLPPPARDPTPITLLPFMRLKSLELRGCDLSTSAPRGLLELRPVLEKLICHNSVNALRHIFAEQTVEIQDAQVWSKLAAVACPCNGLVLMDESLQLLPFVDALDLSRNNLAKVANLQKCTRLKFVDLGFNHITSVASLNQVLGNITKLVLRNNALVSTRGIEKLYFLEALDLSHNIISNFHEVETLGCLPALHFLWLNGNPITVSSYYREEVLSFFHDPTKLELDGKSMTKLERWVMGRIISGRVKRRASYGVYVPAKSLDTPPHDAGQSSEVLPIQQRIGPRKKNTRLASIDDTGGDILVGAADGVQQDLQTPVGDSESTLTGVSEVKEQVDPEVTQLIQQIEDMKREGSSTWLNDLVGFWESDGTSPSSGKSALNTGSESSPSKQNSKQLSWMKRRKRGKEEARRRLEDVAVPQDLREAVHVLESVTRADIENVQLDNEEGSVGSWQGRADGLDGLPASPPHYDSTLLHRRQSLVNEMLRLPLDLSATSSDSESDSVSDPSNVPVSNDTGSSSDSSDTSSLVVDKRIDPQNISFEIGDDSDVSLDHQIAEVDVGEAGPSSMMHSDGIQPEPESNGSKNQTRLDGEKVSMPEKSPAAAHSPQNNDDVVANAGGGGSKRKHKPLRRIVILGPEKNTDVATGLRSPLLYSGSYQTEVAPQLAAPPLPLARTLSSPRRSNEPSSPVKRSASSLARMVRRASSSLAKTVKIANDLGQVKGAQRAMV